MTLIITTPTAVLGTNHENDAKEAQDYPLISHFPGLLVRHYETKYSDEYILPTGKDIGERNEEGRALNRRVELVKFKNFLMLYIIQSQTGSFNTGSKR